MNSDGVIRHSSRTVATGNISAQHGADGAVHVADGQTHFHGRAAFQCRARMLDQCVIECLVQGMILWLHAVAGYTTRNWRVVENRGQIDAPRLPMVDRGANIEHIYAPDHLIDGAETHLRHALPHLFGNKKEEIDDVLGLSLKLLAQYGILRRDAYRTRIQMAFAHHDAAHGDQRRGGETEFFGTQQGGYDDVTSSLQFAIGLHTNAAAQV